LPRTFFHPIYQRVKVGLLSGGRPKKIKNQEFEVPWIQTLSIILFEKKLLHPDIGRWVKWKEFGFKNGKTNTPSINPIPPLYQKNILPD
jgi:hypothetical protein